MDALSDDELIARYRAAPNSDQSRQLIDEQFRRHRTRVVAWCLHRQRQTEAERGGKGMEDELLRQALAPGKDCLSIEELGRYADGALSAEDAAAATAHVRRCPSCQAELALFDSVTSPGLRPGETAIVHDAMARLDASPSRRSLADDVGMALLLRRLGMFRVAALAAVVVLVAAGSLYLLFLQKAPELPGSVGPGNEVTRSLAVEVLAPVGDQREPPERFTWRPVDRAVRYRLRLMEVDRHEVWITSTTAPAADLPALVRKVVVPGRTLLWEVTAYDAAGAPIAQSGVHSFGVPPRR